MFLAFASETLGPWWVEMKKFVKTLDDGLIRITGNRAAEDFLFRRISWVVQRGNDLRIRYIATSQLFVPSLSTVMSGIID